MWEIPFEYIAFIAIVLGVIGRTYFPYLRKKDQNKWDKDFKFDMRYIATMVFSGIITTIFVYKLFVVLEDRTMLEVFIGGFIFGWGANDVTNKFVK